MFKKLAISVCLLMTLCTSAYAEQEIIENPEAVEGTALTDVKEEILFETEQIQTSLKEISVDMYFDEISERLSKKINLKKPEEFEHMMKGNSRVVYNNVCDYINFICTNDFDEEQLKTINRILENGTTIQSLIQVYEFWLTTDYDFSMVEEICALEDKYFSEYWYESAFNKITDYVHGELDGMQIREYQESGISTDQILAANIMCRKEGQNIFNILDEVLLGNSIEAQAEALYGAEVDVNEQLLFTAVKKLAMSSNTENMFNSRSVLIVKNNDFCEAVSDIVADEVARVNIESYEPTWQEDFTALKNSKYPVSVQRALMNKGFTPQEIKKSSEFFAKNYFEAAKLAREMLKNEN